MTEWLNLSDSDRLLSLQQASARSGISLKAVEKDWWVTLVLKVVFKTKYAKHLQFKGGTSLNKCWNLIHRFSEDIDLSIERDFLGFDENISKSQVKRLKKVATEFTSTALREAVEDQMIRIGVPAGMISIIADPISETMPDIDPQTIRINYSSLLDSVPYIEDSVKMEVSARSLKEVGIGRTINSILGEYMVGFPWSGNPFNISSVHPKRTFLEKIFLLHEEFLKPLNKINFNRMSRHLYDIERMMDTMYATEALSNLKYYEAIVSHRRKFIFKQGVDYDTLYPQTISFLPPIGIQ
jgi:predicted nucleotidyltransferase component of viral defense system